MPIAETPELKKSGADATKTAAKPKKEAAASEKSPAIEPLDYDVMSKSEAKKLVKKGLMARDLFEDLFLR